VDDPPLPVLRYGGLAGAGLLALASVMLRPRTVEIALWLTGTVLLAGAWLLLGHRLTSRRLEPVPLRWLLVTAAIWAVPLLFSAPLASQDVYAYACQGSLVTAGIDPYTHGAAALPCPWLHQVQWMWRDTPSPYGPLWLVIAGLAAATGSLVAAIVVVKLVAVAGIGLLGWAGHRLGRALGTDPVQGAWLALASPLVLVHAFAGGHNDALLAGLLVVTLAAASAGERTALRAVGVGALFGLTVAVKGSMLVALPFVILLATRERSWWSLLRAGLATIAGTLASYGLLWAGTGYGLGWLPALASATEHIVEPTSIPTGLGMTTGRVLRILGRTDLAPHAVGVFRTGGLVLVAMIAIVLWWWAWRRFTARETVLATGIALAVTVPLGPVAFPWYLLTPLAVLGYSIARERYRFWLGLAVTPTMLLILPSGNGLASMYRRQGGVLDTVLVLGLLLLGAWYLYRRRRVLTRTTG
jgi:alpha-1,6-mannosyltransferase